MRFHLPNPQDVGAMSLASVAVLMRLHSITNSSGEAIELCETFSGFMPVESCTLGLSMRRLDM
jgi:hypothetical protein